MVTGERPRCIYFLHREVRSVNIMLCAEDAQPRKMQTERKGLPLNCYEICETDFSFQKLKVNAR